MAQRIKIDITGVSFPFTTEYSIDSGTTWTAKAINEEYVIPYDSITDPDKKIMIRSDSTSATALTRENINLDNISYSNITIKNGKHIESMEGLFSGAFLGDVKISGVPKLKNIRSLAKNSIFRDVYIEPLPKCEDAYNAFAYSMGKNIGNISIGVDTGATIGTNATGLVRDSMFDSVGSVTIQNAIDVAYIAFNSRINVMGHVDVQYAAANSVAYTTLVANGMKFKGSGLAYYAGIYSHTDFDVCPSARYVGNNSTGNPIGPENSSFLRDLARKESTSSAQRETYYPSVQIVSKSSFNDTGNMLGRLFFFRNSSPLKFGGISYSSLALKSSNNAFYQSSYYGSGITRDDPLRLFASFKSLGNISYSTDSIMDALGAKLQEHEFGEKTFYSNPTWFPRHEVLYSGRTNSVHTASTVGYMAFDRRYARIEYIGSNIVITKNTRIQPLDECSMDGDILTLANSTYAIGNSQGSYCYNNPTNDGCIFVSSDGTTTQAIAGVVLDEKAMLSSDEKWLYKMSSEKIDTTGTVGQNIVQTIHKYSLADGTIAETITINNTTDTHARLFYKAFDDYDLKIIFDRYSDASGSYDKDGSFVTSIDREGNISHEPVELAATSPVDIVFHHYGETFEFSGVHLSSGVITRMIGK